jgi:transposase
LVPTGAHCALHHPLHTAKIKQETPARLRQGALPQPPQDRNMFGKLKDWRRIHTRYDRCAHTFFSAICIAAIVIFWINQ